jgi:hypothetical protein
MATVPDFGGGADAAAERPSIRSLRIRQTITVLLLFGGYGALYFCRADLSVATPLLIDELGKHGVSHADAIIRMGEITSFGVLAYALGKLFLTGLGRPHQLRAWTGRGNRIHAAVRLAAQPAAVHPGLDRQPSDPVDCLGRSH